VAPAQVSIGFALLAFCQSLGVSVFLAVSNAIFGTTLASQLRAMDLGVDGDKIIAAGATGFRDVVPLASIPAIARAFSNSVNRVFVLSTVLVGAIFFFALGLGWKDMRRKSPADTKSAP